MPQFAMIVYSPKPADPSALDEEHLKQLADFPDHAKALRGKVLGGTYFAKERGFAFEGSDVARTVTADGIRDGVMIDADLVAAALFVLAAPDIDTATRIAQLHPAVKHGGLEIRPLFVPENQSQDDYAD